MEDIINKKTLGFNKYRIINGSILLIFVVALFIINLNWLGYIFIFGGVVKFLFSYFQIQQKIQKYKVVYYSFFVFFFIGISIVLKLFFIEFFYVPSNSMEDTILKGDRILTNKLVYGPRIPTSLDEIPWFNMFGNNSLKNNTNKKLKHRKLGGYSDVQYNDVVVFYAPFISKRTFVKRCVGLPGDTLFIKNEKLFINNVRSTVPEFVNFETILYYKNYDSIIQYFNENNINLEKIGYKSDTLKNIHINLTIQEFNKLKMNQFVDSIVMNTAFQLRGNELFPRSDSINWTSDYYGPIVIPKSGLKIKLTKFNILVYSEIIKKFENSKNELQENEYYTFKNNYYWMMGDNRHGSHDSRRWGFVPEQNIIGKAWFVLFSKKDDSQSLSRFFYKIQ